MANGKVVCNFANVVFWEPLVCKSKVVPGYKRFLCNAQLCFGGESQWAICPLRVGEVPCLSSICLELVESECCARGITHSALKPP